MSAGAPGGGARESLEVPLARIVDELAQESRAPGGGSAAALTVVLAAAVVSMAARRSRSGWSDAAGAIAQAQTLRRRATPLAPADAEALRAAVALLDGAAAPSEHRDYELATALARAADVPLAIAQVGADVAALAKTVAERGSPEVQADAVAAAVLAAGAARAAAHLVEINLTATADDVRVLAANSLAAAAASWAEGALALGR